MHKYISVLGLVVILCLTVTNNGAFAKEELDPELGPYMVDEGEVEPKEDQLFGWDEKPFLFLQFNEKELLPAAGPLFIKWKLKYKADDRVFRGTQQIDPSKGPVNVWDSFNEWDIHRKEGQWGMKVSWWAPDSSGEKKRWGSQTVNFTVTPEPISSILFLLGGGPLVAAYFRKRRRNS